MTGNSSFDQKNQSVPNQINIAKAEKVIIPSSGSAVAPLVPQQIRRPPPDFKGRKDEIREIVKMFDDGATVIGVRGLGGIGKTALALILGYRLKDRFPEGQLFLDMQGMSKSPLKPEDAMAHIIRSYRGADAPLPEDLNGLSGLYQSVLSGKRALILLDNAGNREQVEPLFPPEGSALLITSRYQFALAGLKEKDLGVLPLEDAKKLLQEIAGRIDEHAEELAKLCGCLPLALRNAAYALAEKKNLGVAEYTERLKDARKRLELVDASFNLSYELLTPELQSLWCLLSVFPADFDLLGAAAVWEREQIPAEDALSELMKWSLVDFLPASTSEGGRYRLHDLARDFAASHLDAGACDFAKQRHAEHYKNMLLLADAIFTPGKENFLEGLKLFDLEKANILAGQSWAEKNLKVNSSARELCKAYAGVGVHVLELRLIPKQLIPWLETGLEASRSPEDNVAEGALLSNLGNAYSNLGKPVKAIEHYEQALKIARESGDKRGEGKRLGNMGSAYSNLGEPRKAIEYHEQALNISREIGDRRGEGKHQGNLGRAYSDLGELLKAVEYYEQALKIARESGNRLSESANLNNMGLAYSNLGEIRKSIEYYEQALKISREIGDKRSEGNHLSNLGSASSVLGEARKAIELHEMSLRIAIEIGDRQGEGERRGNLGIAYSDLGNVRKAIEYYESALKISCEIEDRRSEGAHLGNLSIAYSHLDEPRKAIEYYEHALKISREIGDLRCEGTLIFNMSMYLDRLGQRAKAITLAKSALAIFEQIESPNAETVRKALAAWKS